MQTKTEESSRIDDNSVRSLFNDMEIPKEYILESGSFKNDCTDVRDIRSVTFKSKYQSCLSIEISQLVLKIRTYQ
jgi:hypothetical protein